MSYIKHTVYFQWRLKCAGWEDAGGIVYKSGHEGTQDMGNLGPVCVHALRMD